MFEELAVFQGRLGLRDVSGVLGVLLWVDSPLPSALPKHQGVNILLVFGVDRLHVPMRGPIVEEGGAHGQQGHGAGLVVGPMLYQFIQFIRRR